MLSTAIYREKKKRTKVIRQRTDINKKPKSTKVRVSSEINLKLKVLFGNMSKTEELFWK